MKRMSRLFLVVLLVTALAGTASAEETTVPGYAMGEPWGILFGYAEMTYDYNGSTYTTVMTGFNEVTKERVPEPPEELYIKLWAWDGSTFEDYIDGLGSWFNPEVTYWVQYPNPRTYTWYPINPHVTSYHRAVLNSGYVDIANTSIYMNDRSTVMASNSEAIAADPWVTEARNRLSVYGRRNRGEWTAVTLATSASDLVELLGKDSGIGLADLFNTTLVDQYLHPGDYMPGLLVAPSGKVAAAVFFGADGSTTEVELKAGNNGQWVACDVTTVGAPKE